MRIVSPSWSSCTSRIKKADAPLVDMNFNIWFAAQQAESTKWTLTCQSHTGAHALMTTWTGSQSKERFVTTLLVGTSLWNGRKRYDRASIFHNFSISTHWQTACLDKINHILPAEHCWTWFSCLCVRAQTHMWELHAARGYCPAKVGIQGSGCLILHAVLPRDERSEWWPFCDGNAHSSV